MLSAKSYAGLRVADIAATAGMSTAAFHCYFSGREEAAREVLSGLIRRLYVAAPAHADGAGAFAATIENHLQAIQVDAPLVQALNQAVQLDPVLAELSENGLRIWRVRLDASLGGSGPQGLCIDDRPAPDVLDLMVAGLAQTAATALTANEISQLASDIARVWRTAIQGARPRSSVYRGTHDEAGPAHA
jgi:AcrR family transcriptional regulator